MTDNKIMKYVLIGLAVIIAIAGYTFFFTKDEGGITGVEALRQAGGGFWLWAVIGTVAAGVLLYFVSRHIKAMSGYGVKLSVLLPALLLLCIVWGKGCEIKADGIGGANHKVSPKPNDNREAAEDMLKK